MRSLLVLCTAIALPICSACATTDTRPTAQFEGPVRTGAGASTYRIDPHSITGPDTALVRDEAGIRGKLHHKDFAVSIQSTSTGERVAGIYGGEPVNLDVAPVTDEAGRGSWHRLAFKGLLGGPIDLSYDEAQLKGRAGSVVFDLRSEDGELYRSPFEQDGVQALSFIIPNSIFELWGDQFGAAALAILIAGTSTR